MGGDTRPFKLGRRYATAMGVAGVLLLGGACVEVEDGIEGGK
jgi:hypothetical protein